MKKLKKEEFGNPNRNILKEIDIQLSVFLLGTLARYTCTSEIVKEAEHEKIFL